MPHHHRPPTPSLTLHIPSLHDSTPLETRIYLPSEFRVSTTPSSPSFRSTNVTFQDNNSVRAGKRKRKAAVVAHPYAPLGGSFDDFVVMRLVELFVARGWVVGTFNFRGAGGSKGKTTWTGKAEVQDYVSVTAWLLAYIQALPPPPTAATAATTNTLLLPSSINVSSVNLLPAAAKSEAEREPGGGAEGKEEEEVIQLILAGYSYGSLITANLPPTESIFSLLSQEDGLNKGFARSLDSARSCARRWWDSHATSRTSYSGSRSLDLSRSENFKATLAAEIAATEDEDSHPEKGWKIITSYALISPLLPPVSSFLMGFGIGAAGGGFWNLFGSPGHHHHHHHHHHKKGRKNPPPPVHEAAESIMDPSSNRHTNLLAVYGDGDNFTAAKKYRKWNEKMLAAAAATAAAGTTTAMGRSNKIFKGVEVEGAGHFWHEPGVVEDMEAAVVKWLATHA